MVGGLAIEGLEARALHDPEVTAILYAAGLSVPTKPSLLVISGDDVALLSGLQMRRRLVAVVGLRRAGTILDLLAAEWRARLANAAALRQPSRRGVVAGALASVAGWLAMSGVANAAPRPSKGNPGIRRADHSEMAAALATPAVRRAIQTWGDVDREAFVEDGDGLPVLMLLHPRHQIVTVVDASPGRLRGEGTLAVSVGALAGSERAFRYYTVGGHPFADVHITGKDVAVSAAPSGGFVAGSHPEAEPDLPQAFYCLQACLHIHLTIYCYDTCSSCAEQVIFNRNWALALVCLQCLGCGGKNAFKCMLQCFYGT